MILFLRMEANMPIWNQVLAADIFFPSLDNLVRVIMAMIFGGIIGLERELRDKPAGFRTIILICLGACIFTILSQVIGGPDRNNTRIAAQIVTGIGFLGAGAILRDRGSVFGLTTAATIWAVAAIGMSTGFAQYGLAIIGTVSILVALFLFDAVEKYIGERRDIQEYHIVVKNTTDTFDEINAMFEKAELRIRKRTCYEEEASLVLHIIAVGAKAHHEKLRLDFALSSDYTLRRR